MVTSLTITFSGIVTLDPGAISIVQRGGTSVAVVLSATVVGNQTVVEVTFTGSGVIGGSVADGRYDLTVFSNRVHDRSGQGLNGDYVASNAFFRLFGDANGDGVVDNRDTALFRGTYNKTSTDAGYLALFDYEGNGIVDVNDQRQVMLRYGKKI
jgi:hypothetical protein